MGWAVQLRSSCGLHNCNVLGVARSHLHKRVHRPTAARGSYCYVLGISIPRTETYVLRYFPERMPCELFVPATPV
jgi:hypothetical protein